MFTEEPTESGVGDVFSHVEALEMERSQYATGKRAWESGAVRFLAQAEGRNQQRFKMSFVERLWAEPKYRCQMMLSKFLPEVIRYVGSGDMQMAQLLTVPCSQDLLQQVGTEFEATEAARVAAMAAAAAAPPTKPGPASVGAVPRPAERAEEWKTPSQRRLDALMRRTPAAAQAAPATAVPKRQQSATAKRASTPKRPRVVSEGDESSSQWRSSPQSAKEEPAQEDSEARGAPGASASSSGPWVPAWWSGYQVPQAPGWWGAGEGRWRRGPRARAGGSRCGPRPSGGCGPSSSCPGPTLQTPLRPVWPRAETGTRS